MYKIRPCKVEDIRNATGIDSLLGGYADESSISEIGNYFPNWETYVAMEDAGILHVIGVFNGDTIVGFASVLITELPHYSRVVATTESFYVDLNHRKSGTGQSLLRVIEALAIDLGASTLLVSAPHNGRLEKLLPHKGYRETNRVFTKALT